MAEKQIHFGYFVRAERERRNWSRTEMGRRVAMADPESGKKTFSDKRLYEIEGMPDPDRVYPRTRDAIAVALGFEPAAFDRAWRTTPVAPPSRPQPVTVMATDAPEGAVIHLSARLWGRVTAEAERTGKTAYALMADVLRRYAETLPDPDVSPVQSPPAGKDRTALIRRGDVRHFEGDKEEKPRRRRK